MRNKKVNWIFRSKLNHFIALFGVSVLMELAFLIFSIKLFIWAVIGSLCTSVFICITDGNKKWV